MSGCLLQNRLENAVRLSAYDGFLIKTMTGTLHELVVCVLGTGHTFVKTLRHCLFVNQSRVPRGLLEVNTMSLRGRSKLVFEIVSVCGPHFCILSLNAALALIWGRATLVRVDASYRLLTSIGLRAKRQTLLIGLA